MRQVSSATAFFNSANAFVIITMIIGGLAMRQVNSAMLFDGFAMAFAIITMIIVSLAMRQTSFVKCEISLKTKELTSSAPRRGD